MRNCIPFFDGKILGANQVMKTRISAVRNPTCCKMAHMSIWEREQTTNQTTCLHKIAWYPVRHQRQLGNNHQDGLPKSAMLLLLPGLQDKSTADSFCAVLNSSASILSASIFCYSGSVSTGHLYHLRIHRWCSYCRCPVPEYLYMSFRT